MTDNISEELARTGTRYAPLFVSFVSLLQHWEWLDLAWQSQVNDWEEKPSDESAKAFWDSKYKLPNQYLDLDSLNKIDSSSATVELRLARHNCSKDDCDSCLLLHKGYAHLIVESPQLDVPAYLMERAPSHKSVEVDGDFWEFKSREYPPLKLATVTGDGFDVPKSISRANYSKMDKVSEALQRTGYFVIQDSVSKDTPTILTGDDDPHLVITVPYRSYVPREREIMMAYMDNLPIPYARLDGDKEEPVEVYPPDSQVAPYGTYPLWERWFWDLEERQIAQIRAEAEKLKKQAKEEKPPADEAVVATDTQEVAEGEKLSFGQKFFKFMFNI